MQELDRKVEALERLDDCPIGQHALVHAFRKPYSADEGVAVLDWPRHRPFWCSAGMRFDVSTTDLVAIVVVVASAAAHAFPPSSSRSTSTRRRRALSSALGNSTTTCAVPFLEGLSVMFFAAP